MKILLMQPPIQDFYETKIRLMPLGPAYLKSSINKAFPHFEVLIRDFHSGFPKKSIPLPKELKYLTEYYGQKDRGPFSTFHQYFHFGESFENIVQEVSKYGPDLIGISSLFTPYHKEVLTISKLLKDELPKTPIILGGSHISATPKLMLKNDYIDFIIVGEGEKSIVEFLAQYTGKKDYSLVAGLGYKNENQLVLNPTSKNYEIDELPIPDLKDFKADDYLFEKKPLTFILSSRSCPYKCSFCSVHTTFGEKYRQRSILKIVKEMKLRYEEGFRVFDFEDDNLTINKDRILSLCLKIREHFKEKEIILTAMNGISFLHLDFEILKSLKETGMKSLNIALVTSNSELLEESFRPSCVEQFKEVVSEAFKLNFLVTAYQIIGHPKESLESMYETSSILAKLPVLMGASIFYLTPNSPIAHDFPSQNESDLIRSRLTAIAIETVNFNRDDIYSLFICIRIINFLKGLQFDCPDIHLSSIILKSMDYKNREKIGLYLLYKLIQERKLYFVNKDTIHKNSKFKYQVFYDLFKKLDFIITQKNEKIIVDIL